MAPNPTGLILRSGAWRRVSKDGPIRRLVSRPLPQDEAGGQGFHR